ncbi:MAG: FAD binding domain-containing protein [Desulfurococcaceae archaeon]
MSVALYKPKNLPDALEFLDKNAPDVMPIAGGTDLMVWLRDGVVKPKYLLDLAPLKRELSYVKREGGLVRIGATTTVWELSKTFLHQDVRYAGFVDLWKKFATLALRFEATIGGNIMTATQYNDYITLLHVFDANVKLASVNGTREVAIRDFVLDRRKTALRPNELLVEISFKEPNGGSSSFFKFDRREILIAGIVTSAAYLRVVDGKIDDVRVSFDMVKGKRVPARATEVESFLRGKQFSEDVVSAAAEEVLTKEMERLSDWWTTAEYRLEMSKVALKRNLARAYSRVMSG